LQETFRAPVDREERPDFALQFLIVRAGPAQKRVAFFVRAVERRLH
jgi:hypothetical protein